MAGGLSYGKIDTALPGVFVVEKIADLAAATPSKGVLTLVGMFPSLKQGVVYGVSTDAAMRSLAPGDETLDVLSDVVFNPSPDSDVKGPSEVRLISPVETSQALGLIPVTPGVGSAIALKANIWGLRGNSTRLSVTPNATVGGFDLVASNGGLTERFRAEDCSDIFSVAYLYTGAAGTATATTSFDTTGAGTGTGTLTLEVGDPPTGYGTDQGITLRFVRTVPPTAVALLTAGATLSWSPNGPVFGPLSIDCTGGTLGTGATSLKAIITGVDSATGMATTEELILIDTEVPVVTPGVVVSPTIWASVTSVSIFQNTATTAFTTSGALTISGMILPPYTTARGFTNVADVISDIVTRSGSYGFTTTTASARTYDLAIEDLDVMAEEALATAVVSATLWSLVTAINGNSALVSATGVATPTIAAAASYSFSGGGVTGTPSTQDWADVLAELAWYNTNVIALLSTSATLHAQLDTHLTFMRGNGANERQGWVPSADLDTFVLLRTRGINLNSSELSIMSNGGYIKSRLGTTKAITTITACANMAALQCGVPAARPINGHRTRLTSTTQGWTLGQLDDITRAGVTGVIATPGDVPRVVRHVTTHVATENLCLTEGSARESSFLCYRGVRATVKAWQRANGSITQEAVKTLAPMVEATLDSQALGDRAIIFSYTADSVVVRPSGAVTLIDFKYRPVLPNLWAIIRPTMAPETATITIA